MLYVNLRQEEPLSSATTLTSSVPSNEAIACVIETIYTDSYYKGSGKRAEDHLEQSEIIWFPEKREVWPIPELKGQKDLEL